MGRYENASYSSDEPPEMSERELLEWAASFSPRAEEKLRRLQWAEAKAKAEARDYANTSNGLAAISEKHEAQTSRIIAKGGGRKGMQERSRRLAEAKWVEVDHPRQSKGTPDGGEWIAKDGGGGAGNGGTGSGVRAPSSHAPLDLSKHRHVAAPPKAGWSASPSSSESGAPRVPEADPSKWLPTVPANPPSS